MGRIAGITFAILLYSTMSAYLGWNLKKWLESIHLFRWPIIYWLGFFLIAFGFIIGRIHDLLSPFSIIGNYWMFFFEYGLIICIITNLIVAFTPLKNIAIVGSVAMGLLVVLFAWGTYNAYSPVVRNLEISVDKSGEPLRVVVASDFHLGVLSHKDHLQRFVDLSNEAKPDAVLLVGDLVDDDPIWFVEEGMNEVMKQLKATYGVYGVLGNHEYYGGKIPEFVEEMKESNVQILMDETILVGNRFFLTGQEDSTNKKRLPISKLKPENEELPWLVMNHTPNDLELPSQAQVDLHVSGHTHLGQLWPNNYITNKVFELDYGHMEKGSMHALVSSGFGFWGPPTRIGSRSELWVVDINFTGSK
ncbi:metallophosphoesterase [Lysinibacillus sp. BW-2-10]|uniref:metallophosphoesterase n=1 Tax=Lysinibacillus sp. BW-2-10 TaxID=2590030 RepID=UPI00117D48FB|nr:metallophosphoesterase [Lysinibacillus sp. BW-2-10]TSI05999.1 metallophosphoesterase [Lysinibacillus sp. BW-2-10]